MHNIPCPLSNEFKVAAEIYGYDGRGEPISRDELICALSGILSADDVKQSVKTLLDWGIVKVNIGEQITPYSAKLVLVISNESKLVVSELYYKYWKA